MTTKTPPPAVLDWLADDDELVARMRNSFMAMAAEMEAAQIMYDELVAKLAKVTEERDFIERERDTLLRTLEGKR